MTAEKYDIAPFRDTSENDGSLRVHRALDYTKAHGPGERFSLWLQGCLKRCPGCSNQKMLDLENPSEQTTFIKPEILVKAVMNAKQSVLAVRGITIQGGEPMIQARNLADFLEALKSADPDFNVLLFSGYLLDTLTSHTNQDIQRVLACTDTLIDGVFEASDRDNNLLRGSNNQKFHHFTPETGSANYQRFGRENSINPANGTRTSTGIRLKSIA